MKTTARLLLATAIFITAAMLAACAKQDEPPAYSGDMPRGFADEARMLEEALLAAPGSAEVLVKLGNLYYDWGQDEVNRMGQNAEPTEEWRKAISFYEQALAVNPADVNVRTDMATLYQFTGDVDRAISEYRSVIAQDPNHPQSRINLMQALKIKGEYAQALREYDSLVAAFPDKKNDFGLTQEAESLRQMAQGSAK